MKIIPSSFPILREAKVVNATDPEKLGRIQLKVYPELAEISDEDCPWCFPFSGGIHGESFGMPLKDQLISAIVWNRYWNEITFLPFNITKPTEHLFAKWKDDKKPKITDMKDDPEEEHFVVNGYEDGFTEFHDTKNSQHGFLHPKETFVTINKDGDVFMQSIKRLTFHNKDFDLMLEADSESGDVTFKTKGSIKIESTGMMNIKSSGPCTVESAATATVKGSSMVIVDAPVLHFKGQKSNGQVIPSGSGVCCALPRCVAAGIPQSG